MVGSLWDNLKEKHWRFRALPLYLSYNPMNPLMAIKIAGHVKAHKGMALGLVVGVLLGFIVMVAAPLTATVIVVQKVTHLFPGSSLAATVVGAVACNSVSKAVGGLIPGVGGAQKDLCAINDLLKAANKAGVNSAIATAFDCSTFTPADNPQPGVNCTSSMGFADGTSTGIPENAQWLIPIYQAAAKKYKVPWELLGAVNHIETDYGTNLSTSSTGAGGWMQFEPGTWASYGVNAGTVGNDATGCSYPTTKTVSFVPHPGPPNICDPVDAIFAAANLLAAGGAAGHSSWDKYDQAGCSDAISKAVFNYNHSCVNDPTNGN